MLESILNPKMARNNPLEVMLISMFITFASIFFSYYIFPEYASVLSSAFITIMLAPFFQRLFASEEAIEEFAVKHNMKNNLFQRHAPVIKIYSAYFLGVIIIMSLLFVFLPNPIKTSVFEKQISEVNRLSGMSLSGHAISPDAAIRIFENNMFVLMLSFITSLFFGAGAVFILSWNASVIGVYAGFYVSKLIAGGVGYIYAYAYGVPYALLSITMHGIPEIFGYFFAGMAGGILSVGLIKEKMGSCEMRIVIKDSAFFILFGAFSIFVGAFIESGNLLFSSISFVAYVVFLATLLFHSTE